MERKLVIENCEGQSFQFGSLCFDCNAIEPDWSSVNHGILICSKCASIHRGFGTQISVVKSLKIDAWPERNLKLLSTGGNDRLKEYFDYYNLNCADIPYKYLTKAAQYYRDLLIHEVDGLENASVQPGINEGSELIQVDNKNTQIKAIAQFRSAANDLLANIVSKTKDLGLSLSCKIKNTSIKDVQETMARLKDKIMSIEIKNGYNKAKAGAKESCNSLYEKTITSYESSKSYIKFKYQASIENITETYEKSKTKITETVFDSIQAVKQTYRNSLNTIKKL